MITIRTSHMRTLLMALLMAVIIAGTYRCAHPGMPVGGEKDIIPPVPLKEDPPNYQTNFTGTGFSVTFDEFIQLKDPAKEIFISPPMIRRPEFKLKGKSLIVQLNEDLRENTTYTIYFGNAITDLNEGNPLRGYEYVFSTGPVIDSLTISGKVVNAFDLTNVADILVMVYFDNNDTLPFDSLPLKVPPLSASKTSSDGSFRINNLDDGRYMLIALEDQNNNFYYDLPNERIGFNDSLVSPYYLESYKVPAGEQDSLESILETMEPLPVLLHEIRLFEQPDSVQRILSKNVTARMSIHYAFRFPVDSLRLVPLNFEDTTGWKTEEFNATRDTLLLWLRPGLPDTLRILLETGGVVSDTGRFILRDEAAGPFQRRRTEEANRLAVNTNAPLLLDLNTPLKLIFNAPVAQYDWSVVTLTEDSIPIPLDISFVDPVVRHAEVSAQWEENKPYTLILPDSCVRDIFNRTNALTEFKFKTRSKDDYGKLIMNYTLPENGGQFIFQLLGQKEAVIQSDILDRSGEITYSYLKPGKYMIKVIYDLNHNGRWDTGNYMRKVQPEKVRYCPLELSIRSNWEVLEEWSLDDQ